MSRERHQRVESIFDQALGISDAASRDAFIQESCGGDTKLQADVRQLIESYDSWTCKLNLPQPALLRCGAYECLEVLGSGGMGTVYRARRADGQYEQEVAVKLLRGSLRTEAYRARFATERQILAHLNHPNIARLLDGGLTADGEPYLVMELVEGEPLDVYCDRRKLTIEARLALFQQVLDAVDAAHRNLVVHRDLKPSNIMVNREGVVKLLDFGTSKLLAEDSAMTGTSALTPAYASPEHLRGEPAATTSDVFSLGVVLFRLLTGSHPFGEADASSYAASMDRALRETTPARPETLVSDPAADARSGTKQQLHKLLKGDLASILRKALAHDAAQRYPSVASMAEDLRRYSEGRPVLARRQDWTYVCAKALRRHARGFAAAALVVAGLSAAALFSVRQGQLAQREADRAQAANLFLTQIFEIAGRDSNARHDMTVRELIELAEKRVTPVLGADPAVAADVDYVLGGGLAWQGALPQARLLLDRALQHAQRAKDIPREAAVVARIGAISYLANQFEPAWKESLDALALWSSHREQFSPRQATALLHDAATTLLYIRPADATHRTFFEEALSIARRFPREVPTSTRSACLQKLAESYINVDRRYQDAHTLLAEAVALNRSDPSRSDLLIESLQSFGRVNRFLARYEEDEKAQREAYEQITRADGAASRAAISQHGIWAQSLLGAGRNEEAYEHARQALAAMRQWMPVPGSPLLWTNLSSAFHAACVTQRFTECETLAREAMRALGPNPRANDMRITDVRANLGLSLAGQGRGAEALPLIQEALRSNDSARRRPHYTAALEAALHKAAP